MPCLKQALPWTCTVKDSLLSLSPLSEPHLDHLSRDDKVAWDLKSFVRLPSRLTFSTTSRKTLEVSLGIRRTPSHSSSLCCD